MGSLSTLTINFECLEHKLRWGGPRAPVALCSVACWDILADWAQLKHPWSVFTRLELLKAYLRWKKKKMRGNTQVGEKKLTSALGWGGSKRPRLLRDVFVVIWSQSWLSLPLSAFLFLRITHRKQRDVCLQGLRQHIHSFSTSFVDQYDYLFLPKLPYWAHTMWSTTNSPISVVLAANRHIRLLSFLTTTVIIKRKWINW